MIQPAGPGACDLPHLLRRHGVRRPAHPAAAPQQCQCARHSIGPSEACRPPLAGPGPGLRSPGPPQPSGSLRVLDQPLTGTGARATCLRAGPRPAASDHRDSAWPRYPPSPLLPLPGPGPGRPPVAAHPPGSGPGRAVVVASVQPHALQVPFLRVRAPHTALASPARSD